jgi:hypothetical protein
MIKRCENCDFILSTCSSGCPKCGCQLCYYVCEGCRRSSYAPECSTPGCSGSALVMVLPDPEPLSKPPGIVVVPSALRSPLVVRESYSAGEFGVSAEVRMVPGDVEVLNDLAKLESLLQTMAVRTNQLVGHTEHTRKIVKEMRTLAVEVREEIELRCGPPSGGDT